MILKQDFFSRLLKELGLKKYMEVPEEVAKIDDLLLKIGALVTESHSHQELIKLEVLISAMRIHGYEYSGLNLTTQLQGCDFRKLSAKSMRIMNRLTRIVAQYQDKYQQKAKEGVVVTISQIVAALFKGQIQTKTVNQNAAATNVFKSMNNTMTSLSSSMTEQKV